MKKILIALLVLVVAFAGCRKDNPEPNDGTAEVAFVFTQGQQLKDDPLPDDDFNCWTTEGDYAFVVINGTNYYLDVFYLNGIPYCQTIKLPVGTTYTVQEFMLMNDMQTPDDTSDDQVVMAAPHTDADWSQYVGQALDVTFEITGFDKIELMIEVLCYEEQYFDYFGFIYFHFYEIVVRQACFFGDICIKSLEDYQGSLYDQEPSGLQYDMPAIFKIEVYRNDILMEEYDNVYHSDETLWLGVGEPLCVWYADRMEETDHFEFKLYIYVDDGAGWSFKYFHSWEFDDELPATLDVGGDGVVDFVLGSCVVGADLAIGPYMDLPATCKLRINAPWAPGDLGAYVDLTLSEIPAGYDLTNGDWPGWCIQEDVTIYVNQTYNMDVYSSIYTDKLPPQAVGLGWDKINWLMNNLDWYDGDAAYAWYVLQQAVWKIAEDDVNFISSEVPNGGAAGKALAEQMYNDANMYGTGFIPLPGYWAAVIFVAQTNPDNVQVVFTIVDP